MGSQVAVALSSTLILKRTSLPEAETVKKNQRK